MTGEAGSGQGEDYTSGHSRELEELEETLSIVDHLHNIFVMALIVSTIVSGIVWIYERILHGKYVPVPLEIQAIVVFIAAFMSTFYIYNARKLRPVLTALGALLLLLVLGTMYILLTRIESLEEKALLFSSFILGVFGHVLYFNGRLKERVDWFLLVLLIGVLVAVVIVFLLTL